MDPNFCSKFAKCVFLKRKIDLKGRKLQVIVKLANIQLTPENPKYAGGVWHVEGMKNEHIVSTGIYYYQTENITETKLAFRTDVQEPEYEQGDDKGVDAVFGLQNEEALNQEIGDITAIQGTSKHVSFFFFVVVAFSSFFFLLQTSSSFFQSLEYIFKTFFLQISSTSFLFLLFFNFFFKKRKSCLFSKCLATQSATLSIGRCKQTRIQKG